MAEYQISEKIADKILDALLILPGLDKWMSNLKAAELDLYRSILKNMISLCFLDRERDKPDIVEEKENQKKEVDVACAECGRIRTMPLDSINNAKCLRCGGEYVLWIDKKSENRSLPKP